MIDFSRSDLEKWLLSPVTKALMQDMKERREHYTDVIISVPIATPKAIANANKMQGMIENIEFFITFPSLVLAEIIEEEQKQTEKREEG